MKKKAVAAGGAATAPTDLLVCFPARARQHLALMPKPICSPSRTTMDKAVAARRRQLQLPAARSGGGGGGGGGGGVRARGSPLFRGSKAKQTVVEDDEPQSPKVTCAGQIKVGRPKKPRPVVAEKNKKGGGGSGRRWITVVEEIERLQEQRKKVSWLEAVGLRRDALPFLGGALRSLRLKVRCFGSLHAAVDSSTDDDDAGEQEGESAAGRGSAGASVFSKWLMVLEGSQEPPEQDSGDEEHDQEDQQPSRDADDDDCSTAPSVPPPNALLLMRCRSAPAKGLARRGAAEPPATEEELEKGPAEEDRDELVFMSTAPDFLKLSIDIAKETWVVGGGVDPLSRSRSWKR